MDKKPNLTRRRVLGGLGAIGVGAAAGGAGAMAYLNDTESSTSNTVQAGTLDLVMDWEYTANQDIAGTQSGNGGASASFSIGDIKPGDTGNVTVCFSPNSNPAWVWLKMAEVADNDGMDTEPEIEAEGGSTDGDGELDEKMTARLVDVKSGNVIQGWGALNNVLDTLSSGTLLDADPSTSGADYFPANHERCVKLEWKLPTSVGNVIQGDVAKFDITLYAEQARHNSNPSNPF